MELVEIMVHSSYTAVYAHIIVVQDDENVVRGRRSIVQSFESQTATHRTVADDGNDVLFATTQVTGLGQTTGQRNGGGRMAHVEEVVFTFVRIRIAGHIIVMGRVRISCMRPVSILWG